MLIFTLFFACSDQDASTSQDKTDAHSHEQGKAHSHDQGKAHGHHEKAQKEGAKASSGQAKGATDPGKIPDNSKVFFVSPKDGASVSSPVSFTMGVEGMEIKPAGEIVEGTGHHHIIVNSDSVAKGAPIPADDKHIHFGKGQTEASLELPPGKHAIRLQFANGAHLSYGPQLESVINITVTK